MNVNQFLSNYSFKVDIQNQDNVALIIKTEVVRRSDNHTIGGGVMTKLDVSDMSQWIQDSHSLISLIPIDKQKIIEQTKRFHIDYFAQIIPIDDLYSLNNSDNPDISYLYI